MYIVSLKLIVRQEYSITAIGFIHEIHWNLCAFRFSFSIFIYYFNETKLKLKALNYTKTRIHILFDRLSTENKTNDVNEKNKTKHNKTEK